MCQRHAAPRCAPAPAAGPQALGSPQGAPEQSHIPGGADTEGTARGGLPLTPNPGHVWAPPRRSSLSRQLLGRWARSSHSPGPLRGAAGTAGPQLPPPRRLGLEPSSRGGGRPRWAAGVRREAGQDKQEAPAPAARWLGRRTPQSAAITARGPPPSKGPSSARRPSRLEGVGEGGGGERGWRPAGSGGRWPGPALPFPGRPPPPAPRRAEGARRAPDAPSGLRPRTWTERARAPLATPPSPETTPPSPISRHLAPLCPRPPRGSPPMGGAPALGSANQMARTASPVPMETEGGSAGEEPPGPAMERGARRGTETPRGVALTGCVPPKHGGDPRDEPPPCTVRMRGDVLLPVGGSCRGDAAGEPPGVVVVDGGEEPGADEEQQEEQEAAAEEVPKVLAVATEPPEVPAPMAVQVVPRGSCLIHNWQEEVTPQPPCSSNRCRAQHVLRDPLGGQCTWGARGGVGAIQGKCWSHAVSPESHQRPGPGAGAGDGQRGLRPPARPPRAADPPATSPAAPQQHHQAGLSPAPQRPDAGERAAGGHAGADALPEVQVRLPLPGPKGGPRAWGPQNRAAGGVVPQAGAAGGDVPTPCAHGEPLHHAPGFPGRGLPAHAAAHHPAPRLPHGAALQLLAGASPQRAREHPQPTLPVGTAPPAHGGPRVPLLQGVTCIRTGDSPFRRNAAFSTPITEYLEQPLPHVAESYGVRPSKQ
nr:sperm-associated antigen 8 isoform X1 [Anas platyrhynchos]